MTTTPATVATTATLAPSPTGGVDAHRADVAAMHELAKRRIKVPQEGAMVGIDNIELGDLASPTLARVDLGSAERGRIASELLLDRLAATNRQPRQKIVQPRLVTRQTTA